MAVEGTLDLFKLPEILQLISQQQKTGILTVQGQQDIVAISFLKGHIVAADALNQTVEQGLSEVLVSEGILGAADVARASAEHQASGVRLVDLLVERRYVERGRLLEALRLQTFRLLQQLLRWSQGDFKFYSGDEVSYEEGFDPISVEELLLRSLPESPPPQPAGPRPVPPLAAVPAPASPAPRAPVEERPAVAGRPELRVVGGGAAAGARTAAAAPAPAARPAPAPARPASAPVAAPADLESTGLFVKMKVEAPAVPSRSQGIAGKAMGALLAVLLLAVAWIAPGTMLLPFPWQEGERASLARDQRASLYLKIDRAAKTFFLLEGRFPDRLGELVEAGLLDPADLRDPLRLPLQYSASEESYSLRPVRNGRPVVGEETTEAVTGNFLLDPEFLAVSPESEKAPLVLLD
jgi:hypothetical protein